MRFFLLTCMALFWLGCNRDRRDIEAYYFPVKTLGKGKVYEYTVSNRDSISLEYWHYRGFVRDSGLFLSGTFYDQQFRIGQIVREKLVKNGSLARECNLYEQTADGQTLIPTHIETGNLFPFSVGDSSGTFEFKLHFNPPDDPRSTIYLNRQRRFVGDAPDFDFEGRSYACVRFAVRETISSSRNGKPEVESLGEERYAKGLGLVYYSKSYNNNAFKVEGRLTDIISMQELEQRAASTRQ